LDLNNIRSVLQRMEVGVRGLFGVMGWGNLKRVIGCIMTYLDDS